MRGACARYYNKDLSRRLWRFLFSVLVSDRHFLLRRDFVVRFWRTHQPVIEPADDAFQSLDAMPRLTGARELMRFIRKTHHHCWDLTELERAKHLFTTGAGRRA